MKKTFDVCTRRFYEKNGVQKVEWYIIGILKENDKGRRYLRLFHLPTTDLFIFEKENPQEPITPSEQQ